MNKKTSNLKNWLQSQVISEKNKKEIKAFSIYKKNKNFKNILQFGSSGLRKKIDLGTNNFNQYNMQVIALAIVKWSKNKNIQNIFIGHDTRFLSKKTTEIMAEIFKHFNYHVYFFEQNDFIPTPFLSYLLKNNTKYQLGIMITASHNNQIYNGCKIFDNNGSALHFEEIKKINLLIKKEYWSFLNWSKKNEINTQNKFVKKEQKLEYLNKITTSFQKIIMQKKQQKQKLHILYSPLQGSGNGWTNLLLKNNHFSISEVKEHLKIDPYFSEVKGEPNPEIDQNFKIIDSYRKKIKKDFDLIILNDGDSDRMRVAVFKQKKMKILNGNDIAVIFIKFILEHRQNQNKNYIFRSFVSTSLVDKIAKKYSCQIIKTKTGFSNLAKEYQKIPKKQFVLAFEESIGYLCDNNINNDKDGLQASLLISIIASWCQKQKMTLIDYLQKIHQEFGYYQSETWKIKQKKQIFKIDQKIKQLNLEQIQKKWKIKFFYQKNKEIFLSCFEIDRKTKFWIRSSQTEPIKKIYYHHFDKTKKNSTLKYKKIFFDYLLNKN